MTRVRIFSVFLMAILAGGGLAYGTHNYLQNVPVKTVNAPTRKVVVANANLALGRELRREDLATIDWPKDSVPEGAFEDPASIVDRGLIVSVVKNELILPAKLASKEAGSGLPPIIQPGKRALSVRVDEVIGVAGYVLPGTHVDVIATANPTQPLRGHHDEGRALQRRGARGRHAARAGHARRQADAGDRGHAARDAATNPSVSRWQAPKERFSLRFATRSTPNRRSRPASSPACCSAPCSRSPWSSREDRCRDSLRRFRRHRPPSRSFAVINAHKSSLDRSK